MNDDSMFMSEDFPGLISQLQANDLKQAAEAHEREREQRAALRAVQPDQGLNISELSAALLSQNADKQLQQLQDDLDKMQQDAVAAAARKDATNELPKDHFPAPPVTV